jgi:CMP-N-acetylneuraminic acid synthetase
VLDRIILSTDSAEIAAAGAQLGLEVPFLRPAEIATDEAPMISVAQHALQALSAQGYVPDALLLLQPTSPLRRPEHIRLALDLLGENDAVCSVTPVPPEYRPHSLMQMDGGGLLRYVMPDAVRYARRQDLPVAYRREGTVYLTRRTVLLEQGNFYGERCVALVLEMSESATIDTLDDWHRAEALLAEREGS